MPNEILRMILEACPLVSRANLARTSKQIARVAVANKLLEFKARVTPLDDGPFILTDFACADFDFMQYCYDTVRGVVEEIDHSKRSIFYKQFPRYSLRCTNCGWRGEDRFALPVNKYWDQHMRLEMMRLGVIYTRAVLILARSANQSTEEEAYEIERGMEDTIKQLYQRYSHRVCPTWGYREWNMMLQIWAQQEKEGRPLSNDVASELKHGQLTMD